MMSHVITKQIVPKKHEIQIWAVTLDLSVYTQFPEHL